MGYNIVMEKKAGGIDDRQLEDFVTANVPVRAIGRPIDTAADPVPSPKVDTVSSSTYMARLLSTPLHAGGEAAVERGRRDVLPAPPHRLQQVPGTTYQSSTHACPQPPPPASWRAALRTVLWLAPGWPCCCCWQGLFEGLDARAEQLGVETYGMSVTTLEEVFLRVGWWSALVDSLPAYCVELAVKMPSAIHPAPPTR